MQTFNFEKVNNRWYVVLPDYPGPKADLEMVCGADNLLDIISQGEVKAEINISLDYIDNAKFILTFKYDEAGGGVYLVKSNMHEFDIWLCGVMFYIFDALPDIIYVY
jgi:hypothetical protein